MRHGLMYQGGFEQNFPTLAPGTRTFRGSDGVEQPLPEWPAVRLRHEPAFSRDTVASIERGVPLSRAILEDLGPVDWLSIFVGMGRSYGRTVRVPPAALAALRPRNADWRLDELELVFPVRVIVRLRDGSELVAERRLHPGQKGTAEQEIDEVLTAKGAAYTALA